MASRQALALVWGWRAPETRQARPATVGRIPAWPPLAADGRRRGRLGRLGRLVCAFRSSPPLPLPAALSSPCLRLVERVLRLIAIDSACLNSLPAHKRPGLVCTLLILRSNPTFLAISNSPRCIVPALRALGANKESLFCPLPARFIFF